MQKSMIPKNILFYLQSLFLVSYNICFYIVNFLNSTHLHVWKFYFILPPSLIIITKTVRLPVQIHLPVKCLRLPFWNAKSWARVCFNNYKPQKTFTHWRLKQLLLTGVSNNFYSLACLYIQFYALEEYSLYNSDFVQVKEMSIFFLSRPSNSVRVRLLIHSSLCMVSLRARFNALTISSNHLFTNYCLFTSLIF